MVGFLRQYGHNLRFQWIGGRALAHLGLGGEGGEVELIQYVIHRKKGGSALANQVITASAARVEDAARDSKYIASLFGSKFSRDQCAAALAGHQCELVVDAR